MTEEFKKRQGARQLGRLKTLLDILYAVLIIKVLDFLPMAETMEWADKPYGLLNYFIEDPVILLRILIGVALTIISWNQTNNLFKSLERTDGVHALYSILQIIFVYLFIYFALADPNLEGGPSSPALQCICLAISGLMGILGWRHAGLKGLADPDLDKVEFERITRNNMKEPLTAFLNTGLAFVGPTVWTIGWLVWPFIVSFLIKRIKGPMPAREK